MKTMRTLSYICILFFGFTVSAVPDTSEEDQWLIDKAKAANVIYQTPYENEPWQVIKRTIAGVNYTVYRPNHNLSHGVGKTFLLEHVVVHLRKDPGTSKLAQWLAAKNTKEMKGFMRKLKLAALYHRAGRENENSRTSGTDFEKERFDKNMRNGAEMFQKVAEKEELDGEKLFMDQNDIDSFKIPFYRYEYEAKHIPMTGDAVYIDQLLYSAHILDVKRVNAAWNDPAKTPMVKENRYRQLMSTLGYGNIDMPLAHTLDDVSTVYLATRGDRDLWANRTYWGDEFFLQNHDPARMVTKLRAAVQVPQDIEVPQE